MSAAAADAQACHNLRWTESHSVLSFPLHTHARSHLNANALNQDQWDDEPSDAEELSDEEGPPT